MLNDEKGDVLPLIKNNARCLLSPFLFTIILEILANALIQEKGTDWEGNKTAFLC